MSASLDAPSGAAFFRLVVEAEPNANGLLRLLEPFVIHDVLPSRIDIAHLKDGADAGALAVELEFCAEIELAQRLEARLRAMVSVRDVALAQTGGLAPAALHARDGRPGASHDLAPARRASAA